MVLVSSRPRDIAGHGRVLATLALAAFLGACAAPELPQPASLPPLPELAPTKVPSYQQVGLASWYGPELDHRRTASGERFDMNDLTAAHRSLPLDTVVRVTNLRNGQSVLVRINDRGPFMPGRVIDLSRAAAVVIDMKREGVAPVRIEVFDADQRKRVGETAASF